MNSGATSADWSPGPIGPKPVIRTVLTSVRIPADLYEELGQYARRVGSPRSYLIVECIRRLVASYTAEEDKQINKRRSRTGAKRKR